MLNLCIIKIIKILPVGNLANRVQSAETLAPMAEDYEDPIKHQEPKYAEVDLEKTESNLLALFMI